MQEIAEAYLILSDLKKKEFDEGLYGKEGFKADSEPGRKTGGRQGRTTEATNQNKDEIKPRSLHFNWYIKNTTNLAPDVMMK